LRVGPTRSIDDSFVSLWEKVAHIFYEVAAEFDRKWRLRNRVIDTVMLMLLIFRLVSSKNTQSYGTSIDDLWDNCKKLNLALLQNQSSPHASRLRLLHSLQDRLLPARFAQLPLSAPIPDALRFRPRLPCQ